MAPLLRGEIRWARIESASQVVGHEQGNSRPVLILSNDRFNENSQLVVAALITSARQPASSPVSLPIQSVNMPVPSWVLASQMRTLSSQRILDLIGRMSEEELTRVYRAIFRLFGIS